MAEWTTIDDDQIDVRSVISASLLVALRDNPIAIAEGAISAPRIQTAAIDDGAIGSSNIDNNAVTTAKLANVGIGTSQIAAEVSNVLVDYGDSHDHYGGDGGTIPNAALSGSNWLRHTRFDMTTKAVSNAFAVPASTTYVIPRGIYNFAPIGNARGDTNFQLNIYGVGFIGIDNAIGLVWSDGSNMAFKNNSGATKYYAYQKMAT